ncbi:hypothetical protein VA7868_02273 [Vibrio aerogenes CECT 7868]|uniref:N-acetyltransferase domain-containing protein n=1 Tax=Vibrio aerogenes CECT 7868 TaxID=1216006 RepID=A0A1M5Z461_9VIBR|nr:GNAT family N-acetyltransferase [Vibrio aerogenes]SHI19052.1 hypothetical protein VA7868_02273 [Vibrio aerogenes CECT 7868]
MLDYMLHTFSFLPYPPQVLKDNLETFLSEHLAYCDDPDFSARFPFEQTGLDQSFFLQKVIHTDGEAYLTGPRYLGGDINQPFIELLASTAPVTAEAARQIFDRWQPLQAKEIRILRRPGANLPGVTDQLIYIGEIPQTPDEPSLNKPFLNKQDNNVRLRTAQSADLDWCQQAIETSYQETFRQLPQLKGQLEPTEGTALKDAITHASAWIIEEEGIPAGLIICAPDAYAFIGGYCITGEIILPQFRGRNLAAKAQRQLSRQRLTHPENHLLIGTIARDNIPSRRSAEKAGRKALLEYAFMRPEDFA